MKKMLIVLGLILGLGVGSMFAFADSASLPFGRNFDRTPLNRTELTDEQKEQLAQQRKEFQEKKMEYRKEELKKALDNKEITQEQYNTWLEHFNYMEEFHKENGFLNIGGFGRGCHGGARGFNGGAMMKGYSSNL